MRLQLVVALLCLGLFGAFGEDVYTWQRIDLPCRFGASLFCVREDCVRTHTVKVTSSSGVCVPIAVLLSSQPRRMACARTGLCMVLHSV
jgi:hypothetical protein